MWSVLNEILVLLIWFKAKSFYDDHEQGNIVNGQWRLHVTITSLIIGIGRSWEEPHKPERKRKRRSELMRRGKRRILAEILTSPDMPSELLYLTLMNEITPETAETMTYRINKEIFSHLHILKFVIAASAKRFHFKQCFVIAKCSSVHAPNSAFQGIPQGYLEV